MVIPSHNGLPLLQRCVYEIRRFTERPYEIIVIDDGSTDETTIYCRKERLIFISFPHRAGFVAACNAGLRLAAGNTIALLHNDVVVSRRWLSNMTSCLYSSDEIGIVGPMAGNAGGMQQDRLGYRNIGQFHELTYEANRPDPNKWRSVDRLAGFCFVMKRELLDRVGYLRESHTPGDVEEEDYCNRVKQQGYRLMAAGDTYVHHKTEAGIRRTS